MARRNSVRLVLTREQRAQIRAATGLDAETMEFEVVELEDRIVGSGPLPPRLSLLHSPQPARDNVVE
jgi:hypothetical protein